MAVRATSAFCLFALIFQLFILIDCNYGQRFDDKPRTLYISDNDGFRHRRSPLIIESGNVLDSETSFGRGRRDVSSNNHNITTKLNWLNDSHQQLMVHWVGEGSNVIICLARDSTPLVRLPIKTNPSAVYISYDYGETFENKTDKFRVSDSKEPSVGYATLDKFYNHPKFNTHCVFADSSNQLIFTTWNNGQDIIRQNLPFHPSEISFYEDDPITFLALDKIDPERKLWLTRDFGKTWVAIQEYVKAFFWSSKQPKTLFVERHEPSGVNTVLESRKLFQAERNFGVVIAGIEDFQIKGDCMFATTKSRAKSADKNLDLFISCKNRPFVKAQFLSELDRKDYHIADVSNNRILVAVSHTEYIVNLYVSEIVDYDSIVFTLSLERILTFFPNSTWKDSWLNDVSDEAFTDLYKVEGLRGIYIASQVKETPKAGAIGPEHLASLITYDHGATWNPIKAPDVDNDGFFIPCHDDCSLHLSQKFSQLYPATRSVSIMSSKSAPGIIIATGVIGKSLKGHPGVFVSRDAGLTWKQVLKDYYFFNMGDHGGVLVAVKYFKSRGETRHILYSTDEGETWQMYEFNDNMLRVYGLMTEPGENTTVFTMFGSESSRHQWLIVKVDLRKVFERDCNKDDFKFWSPTSTEQPAMACVLGRKETYQRRAARANCYTGADYDRPVKLEICQCDAKDYQCDIGFIRSTLPYHCIRDKSSHSSFDPYEIPKTCKPGAFYNRTKGYRKIEDDECSGGLNRNFEPDEIPCPMEEISSEFLLVAQRDHITRIDLKEQRLEVLPLHGLKNVIAIEFDLKNNCLYWADIVNDTIGRQCLKDGTSYPEILVETDLSSIEGMALDWISKVLYFVDGVQMKIEIIRVDISTMGRMRRTILDSAVLKKPRGIAVHPMNGYMFWTDWAPGDASVSRANLDGSNVKRLFNDKTVEWPNGITIDHIAERIYWVDAKLDYIGSSDLDGQRFKKILANDERLAHPFAVAVFKDNMYWDDWKQSMIFVADKDHGLGLTNVFGQLVGLMDLKVFAHSVQVGTNRCANSTCSHICLGAPNNEFSCLCPYGMEMTSSGNCTCPGGITPYLNSTCPRVASTCSANQFYCNNNICIPELWKCDGDNDCGDNSDEMHCKRASCEPNHFACDKDKCIPKYWVCDFDIDCKDKTDELNCRYANCTEAQFKCQNGQCISHQWFCDGESDCRDGSDEKNCSIAQTTTCETGQFLCNKTGYQTCIPSAWRCDGESDCENSTDEAFCDKLQCEPWQFACKSSKRCIYNSWVCDGDQDCRDGSDEVNCSISTQTPLPLPHPLFPNNSCSDWMFMCNNKKCVPYWWKCDRVDDCGDNSDEIGCGNLDVSTEAPATTPQSRTCRMYQFQCYNGACIEEAWVCDGYQDCSSGEDELHCEGVTIACRNDQFKCRVDGSCIPVINLCNNVLECPDGSDEIGCNDDLTTATESPPCDSGFFPCDQRHCIPKASFCDGKSDCYDGLDESDCDKNSSRIYQVSKMGVDSKSINASSLFLYWMIPVPSNVTFEFLPSIAKSETNATWTNATSWIEKDEYQFNGLRPYTKYNLTVYVKLKNQTTVFPPAVYTSAMTAIGVPSPPWDVTATQKNGTKIEVSWRPPLCPYGPITGYEVFMQPPIPPKSYTVQKTSLIIDTAFEADKKYSFWVIAKNKEYESNSSIVEIIVFDGAANIDDIENLSVLAVTNSTVSLTWDKRPNVTGYHVTPKGPDPYPALRTTITEHNSLVVKNLAPGVQYKFDVNAFKNNFVGKVVTISATTTGTPLPTVPNLQAQLMKDQGTTVKLSWEPPKDSRKIKWKYAIYYALNMPDLMEEARFTTSNLTTSIRNLEACEVYMFAVGVLGDFGAGPLSPPFQVSTHYNIRAAPKQLSITTSGNDEIIVSWSSSCPRIDEPVVYMVTVTEMTHNEVHTVSLNPTNETRLSQRFHPIQYGGKYSVTVVTNATNAIPSQPVIYLAPPISPPHQLTVQYKKSGYLIYWQEHNLPGSFANKTKYHYQILISEGESVVNESTARTLNADEPPYLYKSPIMDICAFAMRLVTESGYQSELSETYVMKKSPSATPLAIYTSNVLPFALSICLLIIALGAALGYFVVRHRRLSNSFTQFANSHYDTRRGQATFPGTTDGLDDEDSPVIRGFSDDEPLVIA
ncbi:sortilin-related receptor-like isoform X1 [Neodiprion fabricii]|uniref:sortilin-related receptor-like isoform X1 n=1 Tax=Neodiprion fabricii TaxID=2872261 RepID=UPI001ED8F370|nr:sortilin-related receptor-like isoform X1 [Neodiprion fabricii]